MSPYQAHDAPVHPDLTVALANPIKFFSAHDKKSVKLKEAMGGLPEVCVAGSIARGAPGTLPSLWENEGGGRAPGSGREGHWRHLPNSLSRHRNPSLLRVQLLARSMGQLPQQATGQQVCMQGPPTTWKGLDFSGCTHRDIHSTLAADLKKKIK